MKLRKHNLAACHRQTSRQAGSGYSRRRKGCLAVPPEVEATWVLARVRRLVPAMVIHILWGKRAVPRNQSWKTAIHPHWRQLLGQRRPGWLNLETEAVVYHSKVPPRRGRCPVSPY
ncbi:hypothetical protein LJC49_05395 [Ruminococcaceae bacterium OttesenSCG-928-I18]|nr:hypothetical protein [Ruminococcaceae bacterium OttesenSCG-928-I18]